MVDAKPELMPLAQSPGYDYIDIFDRFSTKLLPVIEDVDVLHAESQALQILEGKCGQQDPAVTVLRLAHTARCNTVARRSIS